MSKNLTQGATTTATLNLSDAKGVFQPLPTGVVPAWATDNSAAVTLAPATDGMSCAVTANTGSNADGVANITATVSYPDGDSVVATGAVTVVNAEDTTGTITFS